MVDAALEHVPISCVLYFTLLASMRALWDDHVEPGSYETKMKNYCIGKTNKQTNKHLYEI